MNFLRGCELLVIPFRLEVGANFPEIEVRESLLSFGAESFVFQFALQRYEN
jgi:hypothetical protein